MNNDTTWFDPLEYEEWLSKRKSTRAFARLKGKAEGTVRGRYKTYLKHRKLERQVKNYHSTVSNLDSGSGTVVQIIDNIDNLSIDAKPVYLQIPRVYGRLPVTGYKSGLAAEEWMRKFCKPIFHWPKLAYVTEIIDEMIKALKHSIPRLLLEPRNHGKTYTMVCLYLYALLELDYAVLAITSDASQKIRIFNGMLLIIESDLVRTYYGDVMKNKQSNMGEMWFHNDMRSSMDPTFRVAGRDATFIGSHPDWLDLHDPVQEEAVSEATNERFKNDFKSTIRPMTKRITCNGTRKGMKDFYDFLIDEGFKPIHRKAIELVSGRWPTIDDCIVDVYDYGGKRRKQILAVKPTGKFKTLNCPNFTIEDLLILRTRPGNLESFESQYQNEPMSVTGRYFDKKAWRFVNDYEMTKGDAYYIAVDPSYAADRTKSGDNTAIVVCALSQGRLIQVDGLIDKIPLPQIAKEVDRFRNAYNPRLVLTGSDKASKWVAQYLVSHGIFNVKVVPEIKNKIIRISSMKEPFDNGAIMILKNNPIEKDLYFEYIQYNEMPSTRSRKDDGLDALEKIYETAKPFLIQYERKQSMLKAGSWASSELKL